MSLAEVTQQGGDHINTIDANRLQMITQHRFDSGRPAFRYTNTLSQALPATHSMPFKPINFHIVLLTKRRLLQCLERRETPRVQLEFAALLIQFLSCLLVALTLLLNRLRQGLQLRVDSLELLLLCSQHLFEGRNFFLGSF